MKNNFSLKFKIFDVFILCFALVCIIASIVGTNIAFAKSNNLSKKVQIYYQNELIEEKQIELDSLKEDIEIVLLKSQYESLLGDMTISISKEKGICISEVVCPNHTCEKQGWIKNVGYPIVCIPNGVYIIITSVSVDDEIIIG